MKRVLVTGARGFLGAHCLPALLERGYEVHALSSRLVAAANGICWHQVDLLQSAEVRNVLTDVRPTHLLHLAWETTPPKYWTSPANVQWLEASLNLLRMFAEGAGERVVCAGTCGEYDWQYGYCREHLTPLRPSTLYGTCKLALSQVLASWETVAEISTAWARLFFMYGPGSHPSRFPSPVISALLKGLPADCSHGRQVRDYLYVGDAAKALAALVDTDVRGPVNIGSGKPLALRELIDGVVQQTGCGELVRWGAVKSPVDEAPFVVADTTRLRMEVGWQPQIDLATGLHKTIQWQSEE
jgi:nucleoside-diphosphate-sugar epimerase